MHYPLNCISDDPKKKLRTYSSHDTGNHHPIKQTKSTYMEMNDDKTITLFKNVGIHYMKSQTIGVTNDTTEKGKN